MSERQDSSLNRDHPPHLATPADARRPEGGVSEELHDFSVSVLNPRVPSRHDGAPGEPEYFADLFLDQVFKGINGTHGQYELAEVFYEAPADIDTIAYRQEVFTDLERTELRAVVSGFAGEMSRMWAARRRAESLRDPNQRIGWVLEATTIYCQAVTALKEGLDSVRPRSRGLSNLYVYLVEYVDGDIFTELVADNNRLKAAVATVRYSVEIIGPTIRVRKTSDIPDYSRQIIETFERFRDEKQPLLTERPVDHSTALNIVETRILGLVAQLFSDVFSELAEYVQRQQNYLDESIEQVDHELRFYLRYLEYIDPVQATGLPFCYPALSHTNNSLHIEDAFDLPLASSLVQRNRPVVCNDFHLDGKERIAIVTGPNQGGKTTYARMIGQIHHLASIGCPVPGRKVQLHRWDHLFTHFGRAESDLPAIGRLEDEIVRIQAVFRSATVDSILISNEAFGSTSLEDARCLYGQMIAQALGSGFRCVVVTFVDGLAELTESAVSMLAAVDPDDPLIRTFRVVRRAGDGRAYALALAERHGLTRQLLTARINR